MFKLQGSSSEYWTSLMGSFSNKGFNYGQIDLFLEREEAEVVKGQESGDLLG